MSNSNFCLEQRQQEEHKSRKLLALGIISSIVLHGALGSAAIWSKEEPKVVNTPIELIIVDAPKPVPELLKPKPEPKKLVKVPPPPPIPQPQKLEPFSPKPVQPRVEKSAQPRVERVVPQPKPIVPPESQRKPSRVESSKPPSNPQPPRRVLTNPSPSASPTSVPKSLTQKTANNSPVVPSELSTENNLSESIPGTDNSQGLNNSGTFSGNVEGNNLGTSNPVAARPTPEPPKPTQKPRQALKCVRDCNVKYPSVLNGAEGRASVRVTVDSSGNVINAEIAKGHSNNQVNEQAILAARKMKFSALSSGESTASTKVNISFTTANSDFERQARERIQQNERKRQAREQQEQQERQAREREQQRQAQLEKERQQQLEQQQEQPTTNESPPEPPSEPNLPNL